MQGKYSSELTLPLNELLTVVLITHKMQVIKQIADRVAVIDAGRIAELGSVIEVFTVCTSKPPVSDDRSDMRNTASTTPPWQHTTRVFP